MVACLFIRFLSLLTLTLFLSGQAVATAQDRFAEADAILQNPALTVSQAQEALALYEKLLPETQVDRAALLLRLTRTCAIVGDLLEKDNSARKPYFEKGQIYAKLLVQEEPGQPSGPYWLGLNLAGEAATKGMIGGRALIPEILQEFRRALSLDEHYDEAGPHRALGRLYYLVPGPPLGPGDLMKSLKHLTQAVLLAPENSSNHLFLAQTMMRLGRKEEARQELAKVLSAPRHALLPKDLENDQRMAAQLLKELDSAI